MGFGANIRFNWLAAGLVAAALIPVLVFVLLLPFGLAGAVAVGLGAGAGFILTRKSPLDTLDAAVYGQARIDLVGELVDEASPLVDRLSAAGRAISARATGAKIEHLAAIARKVVAGIATDPSKLDRVRRFLTYYLPRAVDMAEAYQLMERQLNPDRARLAASAEIIDRLDQAFDRYQTSLVEADLVRIDLDMKLLRSSLDDELGTRNASGTAEPMRRPTSLPDPTGRKN